MKIQELFLACRRRAAIFALARLAPVLVSILYAGSAAGLEFRDRGTADPLLRDMVVAQGTTGSLQIDLPAGSYTVNVTMGDPTYAQNNMTLRVQGQLISGDIDTAAGQYYTGSIPVTIDTVAPATTAPLSIQFSNNSTNYWVVNAVTILQGSSTIHRFDFGSEFSPLADGYTAVHPASDYNADRGFGWVMTGYDPLKVIKVPATTSAGFPSLSDYMIALERFPLWAERGWQPSASEGQPGYFGGSDHAELSMRTMGNYIFVYALLATDPSYDPSPSGVQQGHLLARARECLDHMCRTHVTGDLNRPNGYKWGNHWQSAWWTVRMAAGAHLLWSQLTTAERAAVERVVVHEANRHLPRTAPSGSSSDTKSEENAWDSEVLAWACSMFPSHANASRWRNKAVEFSMNTLSVAQDEQDTSLIDSATTTVAQWVYTRNVHSDFTIENHGAYHFCYMACPLHSFAWAYYGYVANGQTPPASLFHHFRDVYRNIARTWLTDGRFAYVAGKDWPRYAYGLYFIVPALALLQEVDNDSDARLFERERFRLFEWESRYSNDGSFMSKRYTRNVFSGRLVEYETDCAANLGLAYLYHKRQAPPPATSPQDYLVSSTQTFISSSSGFALHRDSRWFCSFGWRSLSNRNCTALVAPNTASDMAEWGADQLLSSFTIKNVAANNVVRSIVWNNQQGLPANSGFTSIGQINYSPTGDTVRVQRRVAFVALGPLNQALVLDDLWAASAVTLSASSGARLDLPNDIFNGNKRILRTSAGLIQVGGPGGASGTHQVPASYVNIDEKLSMIRVPMQDQAREGELRVRDTASRQASFASLSLDILDWDPAAGEQSYIAGQLIRRNAMLIGVANRDQTEAIGSAPDLEVLPTSSPDAVVVVVPGLEGRSFVIAANFGLSPVEFSHTPAESSWLRTSTISFTIPSRSTLVQEEQSRSDKETAADNWQEYAAGK